MISISRLREYTAGERVVFDRNGDPADVDLSHVPGEAVLVVAPVTDAVKRVEGDRVESLDRDQMWVVEAFALDPVVIDKLDAKERSVEDLLAEVPRLGYSWEVTPIVDP